MKLVVDFAISWYLIEFEPFLGTKASRYQKEFEKWYYEEHSEIIEGKRLTCMRKRSDLPYNVFDIIPIIDWINEVASNANPRVLKYCTNGENIIKGYQRYIFKNLVENDYNCSFLKSKNY